ncbi:hypothetical protein ACWGPZ_26960 [Priestia megaterium]
MKESKDPVVLMMPVIKQHEEMDEYGPSSGTTTQILDQIPVSQEVISEFASQYSGYELDTIEIHVKGAAKTGGVTQLFVGLSGEAGVKLVLKKRQE